MRQHLVRAMKDHLAGRKLVIPEFGFRAWRWFIDLHDTRTYGSTGPNPISYIDIEAYARLMRWDMSPEHVACIRALDEAWLEHVRTGRGAPASTRRPSGAVNPAVFDAVFG